MLVHKRIHLFVPYHFPFVISEKETFRQPNSPAIMDYSLRHSDYNYSTCSCTELPTKLFSILVATLAVDMAYLGFWSYFTDFMTSKWNERYAVSIDRPLDCLLNPLIQRKHQRSATLLAFLVSFSVVIPRWPRDSFTERQYCEKRFPTKTSCAILFSVFYTIFIHKIKSVIFYIALGRSEWVNCMRHDFLVAHWCHRRQLTDSSSWCGPGISIRNITFTIYLHFPRVVVILYAWGLQWQSLCVIYWGRNNLAWQIASENKVADH